MCETGRLFNCNRCLRQVVICASCDRGHQYCSRACSERSRAENRRDANLTPCARREGHETGRERQRRHRIRQSDWYGEDGLTACQTSARTRSRPSGRDRLDPEDRDAVPRKPQRMDRLALPRPLPSRTRGQAGLHPGQDRPAVCGPGGEGPVMRQAPPSARALRAAWTARGQRRRCSPPAHILAPLVHECHGINTNRFFR